MTDKQFERFMDRMYWTNLLLWFLVLSTCSHSTPTVKIIQPPDAKVEVSK